MLVKGVKKGNNIELLEEVNLPDNQIVLIKLEEEKNPGDFWSALQDFRNRVDLESMDDESWDNLRDKSTGREVIL